jgi:protein-S-isoprenylcysteine O-methyltransferase Ste14
MGLGVRSAVQSVLFFGFIGLLLFVPAGTARYLEGWLFLAVVAAASGAITVYLFAFDRALLARRLKMGDRGETEPAQRRVQRILGIACVTMMVICGLDHRFGWSHVPFGVVIGANALVALTYAAIFFVFRANTFTSSVVEVAADQTVVSTGPYALVRHPMYTAAMVMLTAAPVALGSLAGLVVVPLFYVGIVVRIQHEELFLKRELRGYDAYTQKTRYRLLPFVW